MSFRSKNKMEFNNVLSIIGTDVYPPDTVITDKSMKKFNIMRWCYIIFAYLAAYIVVYSDILFHIRGTVKWLIVLAVILFCVVYLIERKNIVSEITRSLSGTCTPDKGISTFLTFVKSQLNYKMYWGMCYYNFGIFFFRLGKVDKAIRCLELIQSNSKIAHELFAAEYLKLNVALYYKDYDTVIACANEGAVLYSKIKRKHVNYTNMYNEMQKYSAYAQQCRVGNFGAVYSILQASGNTPSSELVRVYHLFLTAKELGDYNTAEMYRQFIRQNAGTTWYGRAVEDDFIPENIPQNYPGFLPDYQMIAGAKSYNGKRILRIILLLLLTVFLLAVLPILLDIWI